MKVYGDADPPYPLLVVRPHGTDAYFQATAAMQDWDDQYGYEMLDDDIELAFGAPDANLKRRLQEAVRQAMAHQADRRTSKAVTLSASQLSRDGQSRGFRERPDHGYSGGSTSGLGNQSNFSHQTERLNEIYHDAAEELRMRDGTEGGTDSNEQRVANLNSRFREPYSGQTDPQSTDLNAQTGSGVAASNQESEDGTNPSQANSNPAGAPPANEVGNPTESCENCENGDRQTSLEGRTPSSVSPPTSVPDSINPPNTSKTPPSTMVQRDGENWCCRGALPAPKGSQLFAYSESNFLKIDSLFQRPAASVSK